jgi:ribosomal protein S12 methylthiotransferase accessory factor
MTAWYASRYTGLFSRTTAVPPRPHDPDVCVWSGTLPRWGPDGVELAAGGAGWDEHAAEMAGVGEAVERWLPQPLPQDHSLEASFAQWPLDEPAVEPERWVLFHPEQYAQAGFPFAPLMRSSVCRWVCCRRILTGEPCWVPEEFVFLAPRPGRLHQFGPAISTGMSCGREGDPVVLRGLQEVIERDALVGAWWGQYPLEEHDVGRVFALLGPKLLWRLSRPNLRYRCYRVASPFSEHVTITTLEGDDREGFCFSVGSACRETLADSWHKSMLEAVQGRHYVRFLKARDADRGAAVEAPDDFAEHAAFYSYHPERRRVTVLERKTSMFQNNPAGREDLPRLVERLGPRPVLIRLLTPPPLSIERMGWVVVRVLVPGSQPLHGSHRLPFLGGELWRPRGLREWGEMPPHPFP